MAVRISPDVLEKITQRNIRVIEIDQCFLNRDGGLCDELRPEHLTNPITQWFVAETDKGRILKIMYVPTPEGVDLKSAYEATAEIIRIYEKYAK